MHPEIEQVSSDERLSALGFAADLLELPADECVPALNLAECLRLSNIIGGASYPSELHDFASPLKKLQPLIITRGKTGSSLPPFTPREKLLLLALKKVSTSRKLMVRLFTEATVRSAQATNAFFNNMMEAMGKKEREKEAEDEEEEEHE